MRSFLYAVLLLFVGTLLNAEDVEPETSSVVDFTEVPEKSSESLMTLEAMVEHIRATSPRVLLEREKVRRELERSRQERAALLPQVSLDASQRRQQFGLGFAGDQFDSSPFNTYSAKLRLTQTIFDTERYANFFIAKLEHSIAKMDFEVFYQDILESAIGLYFKQLRDISQKRIIEGNILRSQELLKLANDRFEAGDGVKIDVTRAESRLTSDRRDLWVAKTNLNSSALELKALLDLDLDVELNLDESLIKQLNAPPKLEYYEIRGNKLIDLRPELAIQKERQNQARLTYKAAKWQQIPSIELFGDWGYDANEIFDTNQNEAWLIGVQATVPIFEGFRIRAEKKNAAAFLRQENYQTQVLEREIEREFKTALFEMNSLYKTIELAAEEVEFGRVEVNQAFIRYREGLVDNRELIDAQQRLADAQNSYLDSAYFYSLSRLAFARSIGTAEKVLD